MTTHCPDDQCQDHGHLIPNATLHIVNGGHLFLLTEAQEAASLVHQFLTSDKLMSKP
jgi:surfactin synthase thioesterase subunit